jgi:hypothetical protein
MSLLLSQIGGNTTLTAATAGFTLSGPGSLFWVQQLSAPGSVGLNGVAALSTVGQPALVGVFGLNGIDALFTISQAGSAGGFVLAGADAVLGVTTVLPAPAGSLALIGIDSVAALSLSGASGAVALAGSTSFGVPSLAGGFGFPNLTGIDALAATMLAAESGSFAVTGHDAILAPSSSGDVTLTGDQGALALAGQDAVLTAIGQDSGQTVLTGGALSRGRFRALMRTWRPFEPPRQVRAIPALRAAAGAKPNRSRPGVTRLIATSGFAGAHGTSAAASLAVPCAPPRMVTASVSQALVIVIATAEASVRLRGGHCVGFIIEDDEEPANNRAEFLFMDGIWSPQARPYPLMDWIEPTPPGKHVFMDWIDKKAA